MIKMGLINWCDEKITELKRNNIVFSGGRPQVPAEMRYEGIPKCLETYQYRNSIPPDKAKESLICFYSMEDRLWPRLQKINEDCSIYSRYAGIVGMDMSPSVNMLKPRQLQSILINCIYDCLVAIRGIKVAVNARIGDFSTINVIDSYPKEKTLVFGNLGCKRRFSSYSYCQFCKWIDVAKPKNICLYGTFSKRDKKRLQKIKQTLRIDIYHGHNYCDQDEKKSVFITANNEYTRNTPRDGFVLDFILSHDIRKINYDFSSKEYGGQAHGS